jgi:putative transposase
VKYAWIEAHIDSYPVRPMCELLGVSASGFYAARSRAPSARATEQVQIVAEIRRAQTRHRGRYGRRRMTAEVGAVLGRPVNEKRIGRLMRIHDLGSRKRRRFRVVTTDSKHLHPVAANVLGRDFEATEPDRKRLADRPTSRPTRAGCIWHWCSICSRASWLAGR